VGVVEGHTDSGSEETASDRAVVRTGTEGRRDEHAVADNAIGLVDDLLAIRSVLAARAIDSSSGATGTVEDPDGELRCSLRVGSGRVESTSTGWNPGSRSSGEDCRDSRL
jgi:hypothetical protein